MGVLTVENMEQAQYRANSDKKDYGGAAARAALRMIELKKEYLL
jgi:6,7-dimethyl-8-ribityllumazine synthase